MFGHLVARERQRLERRSLRRQALVAEQRQPMASPAPRTPGVRVVAPGRSVYLPPKGAVALSLLYTVRT